MGRRVEKTSHPVNGTSVEQRLTDGFINGTSMALAHQKKINDWFRNIDTLELFQALADDLDLQSNYGDSRNLDVARLSASKYAEIFPGLVFTKTGSPEVGGGTLDILGVSQPTLPPSQGAWVGVVERAEQLGYSVALVASQRSKLGKYVKSSGLEATQELRLVNVYPVCQQLDSVIREFFEGQ